ncbi:MAG: hypothetical protein SVX43_02730 [Cyanobacteriota bacterium]|nr:hypothetical protein [Cyanobacteriota bacterium]
MDIEQLPLLELFTRLRKAGLPLGIENYKLLLQALGGGFGLSDRAALARLCCMLWVKSPQEKRIFDYHFERVIGEPNALPLTSTSPLCEDVSDPEAKLDKRKTHPTLRHLALGGILLLSAAIARIIQETPTPTPTAAPTPITEAPTPTPTAAPTPITEAPTVTAIPNPNPIATLSPQFFWGGLLGIFAALAASAIAIRWLGQRIAKRRLGRAQPLLQPTPSQQANLLTAPFTEESDEIEIAQFLREARVLMKDPCFPISQRQMKQSWRYLRRLVRSGKATELDIQATVNQIGRQGLLLNPVLVPRRINRTQLVLFIDRDGSMVPFHRLSHRLAETALKAGRLGKASVYYFQNCPLDYLYRDLYHQNPELMSHILSRLDATWTAAMIFSDAGALRGGLSPKRIALTAAFLEKLRPQVRYLVWLNPMPRDRWAGTTAGEIARLVPMFEVSRSGFQQAIDVLRGAVSVHSRDVS